MYGFAFHPLRNSPSSPPPLARSLDVEGHEIRILEGLAWEQVTFGAILIEDHHISMRNLDKLMTDRAFMKVQQMTIDSLWLPRPPYWYSPHMGAWWEENRGRGFNPQ